MSKLKLIVGARVAFDDCPSVLDLIGFDQSKLHVTMAFLDADSTTYIPCDSLTGPLPSRSPVMSIEYWEGADVTVAVLNPRDWAEARHVYDRLGLTYAGYDFKPHVTLAKGNQCNEVAEYEWLIGHYVLTLDAYIQLKEFK
jgi:hypothetical protein